MLLKFDLSTIGKQISVSSLYRQQNSPIFLRIKTPKIWHRRPDPFGKNTPDKTVFFSVTFQFRPPPVCSFVSMLFCSVSIFCTARPLPSPPFFQLKMYKGTFYNFCQRSFSAFEDVLVINVVQDLTCLCFLRLWIY